MVYHIAIAEDKPRMAAALKADLMLDPELLCVGSFGNGQALLDGLKQLSNLPDLVLMDIDMPVLDGIATTEKLKSRHPQIKVLMLTVFEEEDRLFSAIQAGADGYLLKGVEARAMHRYVREAMEGGAPMSPMMARKALRFLRQAAPESSPAPSTTEPLTAREIDVLTQLSQGLTYKEVAANLFISEGTIRKHVEHLYRKLQVSNKTQAVSKGKAGGWLG